MIFGTIGDFAGGDVIDLTRPFGVPETGYDYAGGTLTILDGTTTEASLHFVGDYNNGDFAIGSDGNGGVLIKSS